MQRRGKRNSAKSRKTPSHNSLTTHVDASVNGSRDAGSIPAASIVKAAFQLGKQPFLLSIRLFRCNRTPPPWANWPARGHFGG